MARLRLARAARFALPAVLLGTLAAAAPASAATFTKLPTLTRTLTAAAPAKRACEARLRGSATRGVARLAYRAPLAGYVTVRTFASDSSDWDLAVFDVASRTRVAGSNTFGSHEVAQAWVGAGQRLALQACRRSGTARDLRVTIEFVDVARPTPERLSWVRIPLRNPRTQFPALQRLGINTNEDAHPTYVDAVVTAADKRLLERHGFRYRVRIADLAKDFVEQRAVDARYAARVGERGAPTPSGRSEYRVYEDYGNEMKELLAKHPTLMRGFKMPNPSFQGREVNGVELTDNVAATDDGKPVFVLVGTHHAREWPSAEATMEYLHMFAQGYGSDRRITDLLKKVRIYVVPLINPDGFISSRNGGLDDPDDDMTAGGLTTAQGLTGTFTYRRKNCNGLVPDGAFPCELQWGIDPNRNYGNYWGGRGASFNPLDQDYRGTGPWSEPETDSVHKFTQKLPVTALITLHNVAALVLRPPGEHTFGLAPDEAELKKLGDAMGKATSYTSQYGWQLYDTTGTTEDWNYAAAGTFGYTIEIGPAGGNFHNAYETGVIDEWTGGTERATRGKGLREALLLATEAAANPALHSIIAGRAPAGRVLKVKKTFQTLTSAVCAANNTTAPRLVPELDAVGCIGPGAQIAVDDGLEYTTVVPRSGKFAWHVTPSTRPFVLKAGKTEAWTLTCTNPATGKVEETKQVVIGRGERQSYDMPCGGKLPKATKKKKAKRKVNCKRPRTKAQKRTCAKRKRQKR